MTSCFQNGTTAQCLKCDSNCLADAYPLVVSAGFHPFTDIYKAQFCGKKAGIFLLKSRSPGLEPELDRRSAQQLSGKCRSGQ